MKCILLDNVSSDESAHAAGRDRANTLLYNQVTMSESKGTKTKLADRIRKHAEAHPNDKRPQEIVAKLDAIRAELLKE